MIIIKLQHGLGNQLFQYALGKNIALRRNTELKIEASHFQNNTFRKLGLDHFAITAPLATANDFAEAGLPPQGNTFLEKMYRKIFRLWQSLLPLLWRSAIWEKEVTFVPGILESKKVQYLVGGWQSEKYFNENAASIRKEFSLKEPLGIAAQKMADSIIHQSDKIPVSLHIRRGDTVTNKAAATKLGTLPLSYYQDAVKLILEKVPNAIFYAFSDDRAWIEENLSFISPIFVSGPETKDYEELYLMSLCHHHIIANSSFSWWGAWLNPNENKIVIAPKRWYLLPINTRDLVPESWIRI